MEQTKILQEQIDDINNRLNQLIERLNNCDLKGRIDFTDLEADTYIEEIQESSEEIDELL